MACQRQPPGRYSTIDRLGLVQESGGIPHLLFPENMLFVTWNCRAGWKSRTPLLRFF
jgi:hypothetical protein